MSEFNACAQLVNTEDLQKANTAYQEAIKAGKDPVQIMMDMQTSLQIKLANKFPETVKDPTKLETCGELIDWMRLMDDAIDDETRELYVALGGMSNGKEASALSKMWKKNHATARAKKFSEHSVDDQLEAKFELIDAFHFFLCKLIALGITAEDLFVLYYLKNAENFERQENGY